MRFGKSIRYFSSILFVVGMILYLPVAIYVPALTLNQVSGMNVHVITPIVCLVCTFYTCVGGLKAVVWTDAVQSFVMYGTMFTICIMGTINMGGLQIIIERNWQGGRLRLPDLTFNPMIRLSLGSILIGGTLHKIVSCDVNQVTIQRYLSLSNVNKIKKCFILYTILLMLLLFCCIYMGLLTYAIYYNCDPLSTNLARADDQLPTLLVMRTLGSIPGLTGLFVSGVFSAALSSMSTGLNSLACVISQDLINPCLHKTLTESQTAIILRSTVIIFGLGCMALVFAVEKMGTVLQLATMTGAVSLGPLLGFFITGVCIPWVNEKSVFLGGLVSFLILGWICFNAQLKQMNGTIRHPRLPVSIEGCTYNYRNDTIISISNDYKDMEINIYNLSFMWYTGFGGIICCVVSILSTCIFGSNHINNINPDLISPILRKFIEKKQKNLHLNELEINEKKILTEPTNINN